MSDDVPPKDEVDLAVLGLMLLRGWAIILGCLVVAVALAYGWMHYTPRVYAVHMIVVPSRPVESTGNPRGAASAATTAFNLYLQSLTSHGLAERLAKNRTAMEAINPHGNGNDWTPSSGLLQRFITQHITVERDAKAGPTAAIAMTVADPEGGVKFLTVLHQAANDYVGALAAAPDAKPGEPAAAPLPPAARVFDGPYAQDGPIAPHLRTALRTAVIGGLLIGIALVLLRHIVFGRPRKAGQSPAK